MSMQISIGISTSITRVAGFGAVLLRETLPEEGGEEVALSAAVGSERGFNVLDIKVNDGVIEPFLKRCGVCNVAVCVC